MWKYYALLSAVFAALTAILAKAAVRDIDSNLATAIRTTVILAITWGVALASGIGGKLWELTGHSLLFLVLSGIATGLSWLFYFKWDNRNIYFVAAVRNQTFNQQFTGDSTWKQDSIQLIFADAEERSYM